MESLGFAGRSKFNAWMDLGRFKGEGLLMQNKEGGFNISSFQAELLLTYVFIFGGSVSGLFLFPRRLSRFLRTKKAFRDYLNPPLTTRKKDELDCELATIISCC